MTLYPDYMHMQTQSLNPIRNVQVIKYLHFTLLSMFGMSQFVEIVREKMSNQVCRQECKAALR